MRRSSIAFALASALLGCESPNLDETRARGGVAPDPTGVLEGSVLYVGPRPQCTFDSMGEPEAVLGRVVLLLFRYDNPPPPAGSASGAENLLVLPGSQLFRTADCMPAEPTAADASPITRSLDFTWPTIRLGRTYQVRGFYDADQDFNPLYSVTNLATRGDVGGGAFENASAALPTYARVTFPAMVDARNGYVHRGTTVTLGAPIRTERPLFRVTAGQALSSQATVPLVADSLARERAMFDLTGLHLALLPGPDAQDSRGNEYGDALEAAGMSFDFRGVSYGLPIGTFDGDNDGRPDPHPILGSTGLPWYSPGILMRRAKSPAETRAGIPDVLLVGSIRPSAVLGVDQGFVERQTLREADVIVPPVAVMVTNPADPVACRIPLVAPGNIAELYEGRPADCQELPTGNYDVNVLSGAAGGQVVDLAAECLARCVSGGGTAASCEPGCATEARLRSATGVAYRGASYSSQAWSIPNELGCPDTAYRPSAVNQLDLPDAQGALPSCEASQRLLDEQGRAGGFAVVDPDGDNAPDAMSTDPGHGTAACQMALRTTGPSAGRPDTVTYTPLSEACCAPIRAFCGLPLCPLRDATTADYPEASRGLTDGNRRTREMRVEGVDYRIEASGSVTPLCVPFLMPSSCCSTAETP